MLRTIRGFKDILPAEIHLWQHIEETARKIFESYGFSEIRIPIVERTDLFRRSIGEVTDIVEKEMYTFSDRHGESITLRPEGTASVVRAYIEHKLYGGPISKLYYMGPMFRYERPQKGRYRQFYQIGAEVLGEESPRLDAEILEMLMRFFSHLKLAGTTLQINSLGCRICRPGYKDELKRYLGGKRGVLCEDCLKRVEINPLRVLDCKSRGCTEATSGAPSILEHLCDECRGHFHAVLDCLQTAGVHAVTNKRMVRGLDYYTKTTFEVTAEGIGAQNTIAAGGRYDMLVRDLGGPDTPCFGFAIGMERMGLLLKEATELKKPLVFVAVFGGDDVHAAGMDVIDRLREHGVAVERDYERKGIKPQLKRANRLGARYVLILGTDELAAGTIAVKDMEAGTQEVVSLEGIEATVVKKIRT